MKPIPNRRAAPLHALIGASILVIGLYLLINAGYFYALGPHAVAALPETSPVAGPASRPEDWLMGTPKPSAKLAHLRRARSRRVTTCR